MKSNVSIYIIILLISSSLFSVNAQVNKTYLGGKLPVQPENNSKKTDIPFEGLVISESHHDYDGYKAIQVEVTKGPFEGQTHTFYFTTNHLDTTEFINTTELANAHGINTLKDEFGWDL
jgi:hypothetical protein